VTANPLKKSAAAVALLLLLPSRASAQSASETLQAEGVALRRAHKDAEALAVFERALAVDDSPRTRAQVALAEQALGCWVEAERDLQRALATELPWINERRSTLESALATVRSHLGTLDVATNATGAELWMNGVRVDSLPLKSPVRVTAGAVAIEVRAPGFERQNRDLQVAAGASVHEDVELQSAAPPIAPSTVPQATQRVDLPQPERAGTAPPGRATRVAAWASLGGAVALLGAGAVALVVRGWDVAAYNDDSRCYFSGLTRDQRCGGYRDAANAAEITAIVGFAAAGLGMGVSAVLFATAPREKPRQALGLKCTFGVGARCTGTF
jgi:hypothetical protein